METENQAPATREDVQFVGDIGSLFQALAIAQGEFSTIVKDSTAKVQGKDGKQGYDFDYAGLDVVLSAVRPALARNGLAVTQVFSGMGTHITTILAYGQTGAYIRVSCELPEWKGAQGLGSALTYLKRYQLLGLLGVAPSDDDDGNAAMGNQASITPRTRQAPPVAAAKPVEPAKGALTPETKVWIGDMAKRLKLNREELEAESERLGCGKLESLNEVKGAVLAKALEETLRERAGQP